ncbi:response regulator [Lutibacter sp. TH_r2]|uniref:response regulator n=1 Tax=Lutibacter sp. TH_r2 TaxID=3082083 RepID=UPI002955D200|nr:response regulator [Lutibacter sp. TH_r2]MDV7188012.1 response regulator [Lutibacter sp. TH_r2]
MKHLLIIEDDKVDQMAFERSAKSPEFNYTYTVVNSISEAIKFIKTEKFDAIVSDYFLGDGTAFEILELNIDIPIIVTTGTGSEEIAVNALKKGAYDYLIKDVDGLYLKMLPITVKNTLHRYNSEKELKKYHVNLEKLVAERTVELKKEIKLNKETSENLLKMNMIFKNSNDAAFMTDVNGIFTFINPKFTELYGYQPEEVIGKCTPRILKVEDSIQLNYKIFWETLLNKKSISNYKYNNKCKDGTIVPIESTFDPIINSDNTLIGFLAIQRDISEHIKNQKIQKTLYNISNTVNTANNLNELISLIKIELHEIIDTTNFYVALVDNESKKITLPFFSDEKDSFKSIPLGNSLTEYIVKTKKPLLADSTTISKLIKSNKIKVLGAIPNQWLGVPLSINGNISGVLAVQHYKNNNIYNNKDKDLLVFVSDQIAKSIQNKKIEDELKAALEKAKESDRLKTAFLHNISHEIRTPMNGILGFSELLKNQDLTGEKQQKFINIITKSGERMLGTLNDLMDIAKLETCQIKPKLVEINIYKELEYLETFFKPEAENKGITLKFNSLPKNKDFLINTDREKLYAILSNLIKNAIKYSKKGSIEFGYRTKENMLEFYVKDTGIGIPKDRQIAIFDRFVQADIHDKNAYEGIGLGLSITKSYVEMLGGEIWLKSKELEGSTFYFTIPSNIKQLNEIISKDCEKENIKIQKKHSILIVDDDEITMSYLTTVLVDYSSTIFKATNGKEAVEIFTNNPTIELILMDLKMPIMNGFEATSNIRKISKSVVIIAQSAFAMGNDKRKAIDAGCNDYISKPIQLNNLLQLIKKHLK